MPMYAITELRDNQFLCEYRTQSGVERHVETSRERAVESLIVAARQVNRTAIGPGDICRYRELAGGRRHQWTYPPCPTCDDAGWVKEGGGSSVVPCPECRPEFASSSALSVGSPNAADTAAAVWPHATCTLMVPAPEPRWRAWLRTLGEWINW